MHLIKQNINMAKVKINRNKANSGIGTIPSKYENKIRARYIIKA